MKYQIQVEMDPQEFGASVGLVRHIVDFAMTLAISRPGLIDPDSDPDSYNPSPFEGTPTSPSPESPESPESPGVRTLTLVPEARPADPPGLTAEQRVRLLHGRDVWLALVEMWRENFAVEGAPQPDRVAILARLLHMDGASIFAFLRSKQGLTDATRDVLCELLQRPLDNGIKREARLIAENIAQVCSFHAPNLAEMLEYSAEFHIIPE